MFQATHLPCLTASSFSLFPSPLCPMVHIIRSVFLVLLSVFVKSLLNLFCPFLLYFRPLSALTCESESVSRSVVSHSLQPYRLEPARLLCGILQARILEWLPFPSPEDLPDQESNPGLLHCRQILYQLSYEGSFDLYWCDILSSGFLAFVLYLPFHLHVAARIVLIFFTESSL